MANSACINRRLLQAVTQASSTRCNPQYLSCYPSPPKDWIRTVTSSSNRYALDTPGVSFGKENDGVIAPYVEKLNKKSKGKKKKPTELPEPVAGEDYEIGGFIDRSTSKKAITFTSLEGKLDTVDDQVAAPANIKTKRKTGKSRSSDNNPDDQQVARKHDSTLPKPQMLIRKTKVDTPLLIRKTESDAPLLRQSFRKTDFVPPVRKYKSDTVYRKSNINLSRPRGQEQEQKQKHSSVGQPLEKKKTEDADTWAIQKNALKEKFKDGWQPRKKLSPDAMDGIRGLHEQDPIKYSTELLAEQFQMSPEAIRRILKSKWLARQSPEKLQERRERWAKRHDRIWDAQAELGLRPPRTKDKEIEDPDKFEQDLERRRILGEINA